MSKNGMATYQGVAQYVNLTRLPTPKKEYIVNFEKLTGGLNLTQACVAGLGKLFGCLLRVFNRLSHHLRFHLLE